MVEPRNESKLLDAMLECDMETVNKLFWIVRPNKLEVYEHPLLLYAMIFCNSDIVEFIASNTDVNYIDDNGRIAIMNYIEDPDRNVPETESPEIDINIITPVVKRMNINFQDKAGYTTLNLVMSQINIDIQVVKLLLDYGADPLICDNITDFCPLRLALNLQNSQFIELMLKNVSGKISMKFLAEAVRRGNYDAVEMLLPFIADINEFCEEFEFNQTILTYARSQIHPNHDIIELLQEWGANN